MKEYYKNPRKITPKQLEQLKRNIQELGDLSGIVHDLNTDEIISGNQRSKVIDINKCEIQITEKYDQPNKQGTVAWGYVIFDGQKLNYRQVRWNDKQREKANITANALGGDWDYEILKMDFDNNSLIDWGINEDVLSKVITQNDYGDTFTLPSGEKEPFQQISFTLSDEQAELIKKCLKNIKATDCFKEMEFTNNNNNGNAIYLICKQWDEQKKL